MVRARVGKEFSDMRQNVQFRSVVSNSLRPHGWQHARPPSTPPTPGVYSSSCTLSWWCHPTIPSSVVPFFSCLQSFPASRSFQMSHLFAWGSQSIRVSASASVLPINIQDWFPLGLTSLIFLLYKELFKSLLQHHSSKASQTEREKSPVIQLNPARSQLACWMKCAISCRASRTMQLSPAQAPELWATKTCFCFRPLNFRNICSQQ